MSCPREIEETMKQISDLQRKLNEILFSSKLKPSVEYLLSKLSEVLFAVYHVLFDICEDIERRSERS